MNLILQIIGFVLPTLAIGFIVYLAWWWHRKQQSQLPESDVAHELLPGDVESSIAESDDASLGEVESLDDVSESNDTPATARIEAESNVTEQGLQESVATHDSIEIRVTDKPELYVALEDAVESHEETAEASNGTADETEVEIVSDVDVDSIVSQLTNDIAGLTETVGMSSSEPTSSSESKPDVDDDSTDAEIPESESAIATQNPFPSAPIPPRKSSVNDAAAMPAAGEPEAQAGTKSEVSSADQFRSRPIPPRRRRADATPPVDSLHDVAESISHGGHADDSGEIQVVATNEVPESFITQAEYAVAHQDLRQLRLALEASHQELSHLMVARDQAFSRASQQESQLTSLKRQIHEIESRQNELQSERESLASFVEDLKANSEQLKTELQDSHQKLASAEQQLADKSSEKAIRQIEAQHQATLDELRSVLGQREAAEASLARERDALVEQNVQLQRKIDTLQTDMALLATENGPDAVDADANDARIEEANAESAAQIAELELAHQQLAAELSLANETIRQFNQNLSQRDAQLMDLRRDHDTLSTENAQLKAVAVAAGVAETEHKSALLELGNERDRGLELLESMKNELDSAQGQVASAEEKSESLQHDLNEAKRALVAEREHATAKVDAVELTKLQNQLDEAFSAHATLIAEKETLETELKETRNNFIQEIELLKETMPLREEARGEYEAAEELGHVTEAAETEPGVAEGRIAELETTLEKHEESVNVLLAEKQDLMDRLGAAQEEIDARAAAMRQMQDRLGVAEEAATVAESLTQGLQESEKTVAELSAELMTSKTEHKRLQEQQIELKQELACLTEASDTWSKERVSLFARLGWDENGVPREGVHEITPDESLASSAAELEETLAEIARLKAALEDRDLAFSQLRERFEESVSLDEFSDEVSDSRADMSDVADALRADRDQAAAAAAEASATIASLMTKMDELKNSKRNKEAEVAKLSEENQAYRRSVSELHAVANELEEVKKDRAREQETARQRLQEATTANAELNAEIAALREQLSRESAPAAEEISEASLKLQDELKATRQKLRGLNSELEKQNKEIANLKSQLDLVPRDRKEAGKLARDVIRMNAALAKNEAKLQDRDDRLRELAADLSKTRAEAASLRSQLSEQQAILRSLRHGKSKSVRLNADANGRVETKLARSKTAKKISMSRPKSGKKPAAARKPERQSVTESSTARMDPNLGRVYTQRPTEVDDLKLISGVGPVIEKRLNSAGIYQFEQVKNWSKSTIAYLDAELTLAGRISREQWVDQAKKLLRKKK